MLLQNIFQLIVILHAFLKKKTRQYQYSVYTADPWFMLFLVMGKSSIIQTRSRVLEILTHANSLVYVLVKDFIVVVKFV